MIFWDPPLPSSLLGPENPVVPQSQGPELSPGLYGSVPVQTLTGASWAQDLECSNAAGESWPGSSVG